FAAPAVFLLFGILPVHTTALEFGLRFLPYFLLNELLFAIVSYGTSAWRGQQYSLALFPVWIRAVVSAFFNVFLHRPLNFAVTPKTRQEGGSRSHLIPQVVVAGVLVISVVVGVMRVVLGVGEPIGTAINLFWAGFELAILSVLVRAVRYRGFRPEKRGT